jgi:XTP/dITP diphosphohydrolase
MQLLLATTNKGKIIEIGEVLSGLSVEIKTPTDFSITEQPHEHGETYRDNAVIKATYYGELAKIPTLADDSGIIVEALGNELGVQTRRWGAGQEASDKEWIEFFLQRMKKEKNKRARFVCCLAYIDNIGEMKTFEGVCEGVITETLEAEYLPGLPISACFRPDGYDAVYSAMNLAQKNEVSHRGKAMQQFKAFLQRMMK